MYGIPFDLSIMFLQDFIHLISLVYRVYSLVAMNNRLARQSKSKAATHLQL